MRIGVVAFGSDPEGDNAVGREVVARLSRRELPDGAEILDGGAPVLKILERVSGFDGLVIIDAASMGEPPGAVKIFNLNEILLAGQGNPLRLHSVRLESDLLYANKVDGSREDRRQRWTMLVLAALVLTLVVRLVLAAPLT